MPTGVARTALSRWPSGLLAASGWLALAGCAALPLDAVATVEVTYTLAVPHVLFAAACVTGLPLVVRGWLRLPGWLALVAGALVLLSVLTAVLIDQEGVHGIERASSARQAVYVADLLLGLGAVGLLTGLGERRDLAPRPALAFAAGAVAAAAYAIYAWPAQELDWALGDLTTAVDSTGVTYGESHQGDAFFGWERTRGTFSEPQQLCLFLAAATPLVLSLAFARGRMRLAVATGAVLLLAMFLTSSAPGWLVMAASVLVACVVAGGRLGSRVPGIAAGLLVLSLAAGALVLAHPGLISGVTGRTTAKLEKSVDLRFDSWEQATSVWKERPVIGHGPGQSGVQLAAVFPEAEDYGFPRDTVVLGTAKGLLLAALVDVGVVGAVLWLLLLAGLLVLAGRRLAARPGWLEAGVFVAGTAAVIGSQITGDRLELRTWVIIGLMLAVLGATRPSDPGVSPA